MDKLGKPRLEQQQEQRMTFRLLSYWQRARGDKKFPSLAEVDISQISEVYHFTFTIELGENEEEHRFVYFGPALSSQFGEDYTGMALSDAVQDQIVNNTIGYYQKVLDERKPCSESAEFFMNGKEVRYRSIILPLSEDGETIDFLFGTANYKIFD